MKSSQLLTHFITGAIGLALGLALAPRFHAAGADASDPPTGKIKAAKVDSTDANAQTNTALRTRSRNRGETQKIQEPRVSIPLKSVIEILKEREFRYSSRFDRLDFTMSKALILLGATDTEQEEVMKLIKTTESEILAAEKSHVNLGKVTAHSIQMDMSRMRGPAQDIASRTKDGIRASLPADLAEGLITAINWSDFYPVDEQSYTRLEITRSRSGDLTRWVRQNRGSMGGVIDSEFKDDGTPLPADRIFGDRWKPFLKGVTILPKDEE